MEAEITRRSPGSLTRKSFLETVLWAMAFTFLLCWSFFPKAFYCQNQEVCVFVCVCLCVYVCTVFSMTNIKIHCLHHTMHTQWFQNNNTNIISSYMNNKNGSHLNMQFCPYNTSHQSCRNHYILNLLEINSFCVILPFSKDSSI